MFQASRCLGRRLLSTTSLVRSTTNPTTYSCSFPMLACNTNTSQTTSTIHTVTLHKQIKRLTFSKNIYQLPITNTLYNTSFISKSATDTNLPNTVSVRNFWTSSNLQDDQNEKNKSKPNKTEEDDKHQQQKEEVEEVDEESVELIEKRFISLIDSYDKPEILRLYSAKRFLKWLLGKGDMVSHYLSHYNLPKDNLHLRIVLAEQYICNPNIIKEPNELTMSNAAWRKSKFLKERVSMCNYFKIFPEAIDSFEPIYNLIVSFKTKYSSFPKLNGKNEKQLHVFYGNSLMPIHTAEKPEVSYTVEQKDFNSFFTIALITPDFPEPRVTREDQRVQWLVSNIKGNNIAEGNTLVEYQCPLPGRGSGRNRFVFMLCRQNNKAPLAEVEINTKEQVSSFPIADTELTQRENFNMHDFVRKNNLTPVGISFFHAEWDGHVASLYKNVFKVPEPYFVTTEEKKKLEDSRKRVKKTSFFV